MYHIALCRENSTVTESFSNLLKGISSTGNFVINITYFDDSRHLLKHYKFQFDVVLVFFKTDHSITKELDALKEFRFMDPSVPLLLLSHQAINIPEMFLTGITMSLKTPVSQGQFTNVFRKLLVGVQPKEKKILFQYKGKFRAVSVSTILYAQYYAHKITIQLMDGTSIVTAGSLKSILEQDTDNLLIKISKDIIINRIWIEGCESQTVRLKGIHEVFNVSRSKWRELKKIYLSDK